LAVSTAAEGSNCSALSVKTVVGEIRAGDFSFSIISASEKLSKHSIH
jgi:hypothetical protein